MNDNQAATEHNAVPHDPAMAAADPAMFASLSRDENAILSAHLSSGWLKQAAVYPGVSDPWRETLAVLDDLTGAWWVNWRAERGEPEAPEAGA
jgi:hypothetical protein